MAKNISKNNLETTLQLCGCKWTLLIINELLNGPLRFCEVKRALKGITARVLTSKLKKMEENGLLKKNIISVNPPNVEYNLTDIGYSLAPVIISVNDWGRDYKKYQKLLEKHKLK